MAATRKWVYFFGKGHTEGRGDQKALLGGKGAGLAEMTRIGLPVPAGFTITTEACDAYNQGGQEWPVGLEKEVRLAITKLERVCKKKFGGARDPLLVSVRSGAAMSMPGMMESILNLGLNDESVEALAKASSNRRFALDAYRRLIMMYGSTAKGIERDLFDAAFDSVKQMKTAVRLDRRAGDKIGDTDVDAEELEHLVGEFKALYHEHCGEEFPQDPFQQLKGAIDAVFDSWMADKAVTYRRVERISGLKGTAVNVCQMVFGNMGDDSGTGVCFTRDPSTGEATYYGDLLINAQGEDVVAGVRTPMRLAELQELMSEVYEQLEAVRVMLEVHYKDMQDLEFTIERGKLYMLQCRVGKRSPQAAFRIAVEQATKGLMSPADAKRLVKKKYLPAKYASAASKPVITKDEAIQHIEAVNIERLFYPIIDSNLPPHDLASRKLGEGIGAVPGAACGAVVFSAEEAEARTQDGARVILVRKETSPEDVGGMHVAAGILTATGGKTSHAAVVARGWGKCCIVGCEDLDIDYDERTMSFGGPVVRAGESITLDGTTGRVFEGEIGLDRPKAPPEYNTLMSWCDQRRRLEVRANAETPEDARKAVEFGAQGIGLCRTEHMFFEHSQPQRILAMREMILADDEASRRHALDKLRPFQVADFEGLFTEMDGRRVTIRLLDPPLHEFLPQHDNLEAQQAVADELDAHAAAPDAGGSDWRTDDGGVAVAPTPTRTVTIEDVQRRIEQLHEANPMLGHRGCRLSISHPEILEMQVQAIMEAAINCSERGIQVRPEIMIPLSMDPDELAVLVERARMVADRILASRSSKVTYLVGTMVETPRAALLAGRMAESAEFFSFGTNDLTQLTMALSRDDADRFLSHYVDPSGGRAIFPDHPFQSIDTAGVGQLVRMACKNGRATRKNLELGMCGEHAGDPKSIRFCEEVGLDYVSCSPFRVPIARLAAAQAAIELLQPDRRRSARKAKPKTNTAVKPKATKKTSASRKVKVKATPAKRAATKKAVARTKKAKATAKKATKAVARRKAAKRAPKRPTAKKKVKR
ncbi:MAG: pyruvate, phosphate dikinase [Phycisphaerales bacterium]|nr:MAG: pyruvate, phosphate dikinase [Phycisphaerales bacterium]